MSRTWVTIGLLALAGILGAWSMRRASSSTAVPWTASASNQPIPQPPSAPGAEPAAVDPDETAPPPRVEVRTGPAEDDRVALVDVQVEQSLADTVRPLPFVEVELASGDIQLPARTDGNGRAQFAVQGGHGHEATVRCPLGAAARLTLSAEAPTSLLLTIRPRAIVRGSVVDATGAPIPNATIVLLPWQGVGDDSPAPWRVGTSAADGSFEVGIAQGGRIGAHHRANGPSAMHLVQLTNPPVDPPPVVTLQLVLLATPAQVSGTVCDHRGQPVAFAELEFDAIGKPPPGADRCSVPQRARTDAHGTYVVTRLLPGTTAWGARARGHGPRSGTLRLDPGQAARFDIELPPACTLEGSVLFADGEPAAAIVVAGEAGAFTAVAARTLADGSYRLRDLAPGPVRLTANALRTPGARRGTASTTLELAPDRANEWLATLVSEDLPPNLHGRLVDANRQPLASWRVVAWPAGRNKPTQAATAADGAFALAVPPATRVALRAYAPGTSLRSFADAVQRDVDPSAGPVEFVVTRIEPGQVVGRVVANDGAAVPARIGCWHYERAEYVSLQAAADGTVQCRVPPGTLDLLFEHPGCASAARRDLLIVSGQTLDLQTVALGAGGTLFGTVLGPGGRAPDECVVTALSDDEARRGQRFQAEYRAGTFRFPTLPTGNYSLLVQGPSLAAARRAVSIEADHETAVDVVLEVGVPRHLKVILPPGAPGAIALALRPPNQREPQWLATVGAQQEGPGERWVDFLACLAPGSYEAVAWATGGWEARQPVAFGEGDDSEIVLELRPK